MNIKPFKYSSNIILLTADATLRYLALKGGGLPLGTNAAAVTIGIPSTRLSNKSKSGSDGLIVACIECTLYLPIDVINQ